MIIKIDLRTGRGVRSTPTKRDIQKNIDTLNSIINSRKISHGDIVSLIDTRSILEGIREQLQYHT